MSFNIKKIKTFNFFLEKGKAGYILSSCDDHLLFLNYVLMNDYYSEITCKDVSFLSDRSKIVFLDSIYVLPEKQGQGIYEKLLDSFYEQCYSIDSLDIFLVVDLSLQQELSNFNLISFYEVNGFKLVKKLNENQYLMFKKLDV